MNGGKTRLDQEQQASLKRGSKSQEQQRGSKSQEQQRGSKSQEQQRGGDGAHGRTVIDSVFFGRPEQGFYSASEMAKMGAMVGGNKQQKQQKQQKEKKQLQIKELTIYSVEGMKQKRQRGGFQNESQEQNQRRMRDIIANMIDVSDSRDTDIIEVIKNEHKEDQKTKYNKKEAEQILKEFYLFNTEKVLKTKNGFRRFPSDLLKQYVQKNQTGGNRVTLPLTFFTGEIPDKIAIPTQVDNYCDTF
jgi:hypothetical protein